MKINLVDTSKIIFGDIKTNPRGGDARGIMYGSSSLTIDLFGYVNEISNSKFNLYLNKKEIKGFTELEAHIEKECSRDEYQYIRLLKKDEKISYINIKLNDYIFVSDDDSAINIDKTVIDFSGCKNFYNIDLHDINLYTLEKCDVYVSLSIKGICYINNRYIPVFVVKSIKALTCYNIETPEAVIEDDNDVIENTISIIPDDI
jgi:hypothetical protein